MKKYAKIVSGFLLILLLAACSQSSTEKIDDIKQLVEEYSLGHIKNVSASITSHELIVTDNKQKKTAYKLPDDEFFVSIAPFIQTTHPCAIHSLTSCQGELVEEEFAVFIQDEEGNVVVDEMIQTYANGFIDLWLPRNQTYQVKIEFEGKVAEAKISTFEGDNTCITTMQLM